MVVQKTPGRSLERASKAPSKRLMTIQSYELVRTHLPLVQTIARRYCRGNTDLLDDLVQVGAIGLLKAVRNYDPQHPNKASFKTLATCYIRGEIRHYLRDHASLVQVPRHLIEVCRQIAKYEEKLTQTLGHTPTVKELATYSGLKEEEILEAQCSAEARFYYESIDAPAEDVYEDYSRRSLCETVADRKYQEWQVRKEDRDYIAMALKNLNPRSQKILEHVFLDDLTQKETASKLGLSEMGVSRVVSESIKKLKQIIETNKTFTRLQPPKI